MAQSLRVRLTLLLSGAIIIAAASQFMVSFHEVTDSTNKLFDYHMQQMARAIQNGGFERVLWHTFPETGGEDFDFVIQSWDEGGDRIYQSRADRFVPKQPVVGYATVALDDGNWRIYSLKNDDQSIQIAQKISARRDRAMALALNTLWPIILFSILLLIAVWWFVTAALDPLIRVGHDLAERNADSLAPIDSQGVPREVIPLITELNYLLARLEHALQTQQQFLADAAHELRSPITALKLQVQTLERARDDTTRASAIQRLLGGIDRSSRLVEQLLSLARQDPLAHTFNPAVFSLTECIELAVADVTPFAQSRRIVVELPPLPSIDTHGDSENIRIMVRNLLDNAVRYSPLDGQVEVVMENNVHGIILKIRDSGSGIPEEDQGRIFNRFFRLPGTGTIGTGLGLAIVKAVADRHRIRITLRNRPGSGLEISLHFSEAVVLGEAA